MKYCIRAAALLLAAALSFFALTGCGEKTAQETILIPERLSAALVGDRISLDPAYATETQDLTVLSNLYENLLKISTDEAGNITAVPAIAKSYEVEKNIDGSATYTFRLRSAKWSDGTHVTAGDFVYAWQRLADPATASPNAGLLTIVKGYDTVRSTGDVSALQISAKNSSTLVVTITGTCEWFLTDVCTSPATVPLRRDVVESLTAAQTPPAAEDSTPVTPAIDAWASDPTRLVTNGPYCVSKYDADSMTLVQNERYAYNDDTPKTIRILYVDTPEAGWNLYQAGSVDFLAELPDRQLQLLAENPQWAPIANPTTGVLLFNTNNDWLCDPLVRQALQTVIDRTAISTTLGVSYIPASGLVSPSVPDPDLNAINFRVHGGDLVNCLSSELSQNHIEAMQLLAEAGFDETAPFPATEILFLDLPHYLEIARQLADCWKAAYNMDVTLTAVDSTTLENALRSGSYTMALTELTSPINDAQGFLQYWASNHADNVVRYRNTAFDTLLAVVRSASDDNARRGCLHDAESLLLEDSPLTPLYFTGSAYALRDDLIGLLRDPKGTFRFDQIRQIILPEEPAAGTDSEK